jgi:hypothetical protein
LFLIYARLSAFVLKSSVSLTHPVVNKIIKKCKKINEIGELVAGFILFIFTAKINKDLNFQCAVLHSFFVFIWSLREQPLQPEQGLSGSLGVVSIL